MSFKENLKSELEYQGMQLKELSAKCGINKNTLGNYLTGHNSIPAADTAVKIAQALGVSVEYLVTGKSTFFADKETEAFFQLFMKLSKRDRSLLSKIADAMLLVH